MSDRREDLVAEACAHLGILDSEDITEDLAMEAARIAYFGGYLDAMRGEPAPDEAS